MWYWDYIQSDAQYAWPEIQSALSIDAEAPEALVSDDFGWTTVSNWQLILGGTQLAAWVAAVYVGGPYGLALNVISKLSPLAYVPLLVEASETQMYEELVVPLTSITDWDLNSAAKNVTYYSTVVALAVSLITSASISIEFPLFAKADDEV